MTANGMTLERPLERMVLSEADGSLPGLRTVKLSPWGKVKTKNGEYLLDHEAARMIETAFSKHGVAVPVDVEHESIAPEARGKRGAVGWVERIFAEPGRGLFGLVQWSDAGRGLIRSDAFRYLSPVFEVDLAADRRAVGLHSAAITNKPAIPQMERLAASEKPLTERKTNMDGATQKTVDPVVLIDEMAALLGVDVGSDTGLALAAIRDAIKTKMAKAKGEKDGETEPQPNAERMTPKLLAMREENQTLRIQLRERELTEFLAPYVARGVLSNDSKNPIMGRVDYKEFMVLAETNRDVAKRWLDERVSMLPKQVQLTDGGRMHAGSQNRHSIIANAEREFDTTPGHQKATSKRAFVNLRLREAELVALSEEEAKGFALVG